MIPERDRSVETQYRDNSNPNTLEHVNGRGKKWIDVDIIFSNVSYARQIAQQETVAFQVLQDNVIEQRFCVIYSFLQLWKLISIYFFLSRLVNAVHAYACHYIIHPILVTKRNPSLM